MHQIKCNICNQDKTKRLFTGKDLLCKIDDAKFNIVQCLNCGLVYLNPQPVLEELKKYYPPSYRMRRNKEKNISSNKLRDFLRKIKKIIVSKRKINNKKDGSKLYFLDFGCGNGDRLLEIKKNHPNWILCGLDINKNACEQTRKKGFNIFCGKLEDTNYKPDYFDIVNLEHVLEHLNNPFRILMQLNNILKPSGKLIISVPNFSSLSAKIFRNKWFGLDCPRHLYHFTPKTINQLLEKAGFKIQKAEFDPNPKIFLKTLNYVFKRKNDKTNFVLSCLFCWLFRPLGHLLAKFGLTSMMTITAKKL